MNNNHVLVKNRKKNDTRVPVFPLFPPFDYNNAKIT